MDKGINLYLCGGVFVKQLLKSRKDRTSPRDKIAGKADGLNNQALLLGLVRIVNPSFQITDDATFKTDASSFINCNKNNGDNLPFKEGSAFLVDFDNLVKNDYEQILKKFIDFSNFFLEVSDSTSKNTISVDSLIQIIEADKSIKPSEKFYINADGSAVEKSVLVNMTEFNFYSFMLGVWHYAITKKFDNKSGRETTLWKYVDRKKQITFNNGLPKDKEIIKIQKKEPQVEEPEVDETYEIQEEKITYENPNTEESPVENKSSMGTVINHTGTGHQFIFNNSNPIINNYDNRININNDYGNETVTSNINPDNTSFNLFVLDGEKFIKGYFIIKRHECLKYSDSAFSNLLLSSDETKRMVCKFPCLFANKNRDWKTPSKDQEVLFGYITDYEVLAKDVKFYFAKTSSIPQVIINDNTDLFNIISSDGDNELDHVHWAIKGINIIDRLEKLNIRVAKY